LHKLPKQLGWGLGLLAFVGSLVWDYQRSPNPDTMETLMKAAMWGGLCSVVAAVLGYLLFLALGGNEAEAEAVPEPFETIGPPEPLVTPGRFVDLAAGEVTEMPPPDDVDDLRDYAPADIARAVRGQLADEE